MNTPDVKVEESFASRLVNLGTGGQALVAGVYAWSVSVAPGAFAKRAGFAAAAAAIIALITLLTSVLERLRNPDRSYTAIRPVTVWLFVIASAISWIAAPDALSPAKLDTVRALGGMIGWGLFAYTCAAPTLTTAPSIRLEPGPPARLPVARGDVIILASGALLAVALQVIGWGIDVTERALLVRLVSVACGVAIIGGASAIALARQERTAKPRQRRKRLAVSWLVVLALVIAGGILYKLVVRG